MRSFEVLNTSDFTNPTSKKVQILANRLTHEIALVLEGRLVKRLSDPETSAMLGDGIMFQSAGNRGVVQLSDIKVTAWDGKLPP